MMESFLSNKILSEMRVFGIFVYLLKKMFYCNLTIIFCHSLQTKNNRPMRTSQLHIQDNSQAVTMLYSFRFESAKQIAAKRPPPLKQTLVNPTLKNPKHASVLSENNINYDQPLNPMSVAEIRAQRIQREKKQNQVAAVSI